MKRFGLILLILALVLCVCLLGPRMFRKVGADLGGFSGGGDYGGGDSGGSSWGGSDWSSGSDWGGGSTWSSSDSDNGVFFFPFGVFSDGDGTSGGGYFGFIVWAILFVFILLYLRRIRGQSAHAAPHAGVAAGAQRTPDSKLTPMREYESLDPNFSASDLREKLSNVYVQMQNGCTARNIESLRPYFTDALYQQFDRQVKALIQARQINVVERIAVLDVNLRGYFQEGGDDHLVAELKTRITDYTVAEDTGAVVSGSKTAEKFMTYRYHLVRPTGVESDVVKGTRAISCPHCGAPLNINQSAKCPYCDSVITVEKHDFVISRIEGISQVTA
jgi:hypothetical protein